MRETADSSARPVEEQDISVHRAFMYGVACPGWGEWYAGSPRRAFVTVVTLVSCLMLFLWAFVDLLGLLQSASSQLRGRPSTLAEGAMTGLVVKVLVGIVGIYFAWLWGLISAVDVAVLRRADDGSPAQCHPLWALAMSYLCPGCGHVYTGSRVWGYQLFGATLVATVLFAPALQEAFNQMSAFMASEASKGPESIIAQVGVVRVLMTYCAGSVMGLAILCTALAETSAAVHEPFEVWGRTAGATLQTVVLVVAAYICPGSGQLLMGREQAGWGTVVAYVGINVVIGLLLGLDVLSTGAAGTLGWLATLVQWGALIEVLVNK